MKYMSWSFWRFDYAMKEIYDNGDRFYQVGMFDYITEFTFKNPNLGYFDKDNVSGITGKINLDVNTNSTDPTQRDSITVWNSYQEWVKKIKAKWPHIKWFLSIRNDGTYNAIKYLMDNVNNVQATFLSEISRLIDENPWCYGIDLDLEHCGGVENADNMVALIKKVYQLVHSKGKKLHYDLPAMNGEYWSVGSENWCSYARLNPYLDSVTIMSYDFAWQGSAPSAVSPKWWLDIVYDYVSKSFDKEKVFMGLPGYGYCWQIYQNPSTDKSSSAYYRGHTLKYKELIEWQNGIRSHTDTQAKIPFASYVNDEEKCANMYLHIYDIQSYNDAIITPPVVKGEYKGIKYVSAYKKTKTYELNEIAVQQLVTQYYKAVGNIILIAEEKPTEQQIDTSKDEKATTNNKKDSDSNNPGNFDKNCDYSFTSATPKPDGQDYEQVWGVGEFRFSCPAGTYELALDINFTWFDRNIITIELDGTRYEAKMGSLIDNNCLRRHYHSLGMVTLTGSSHVLRYLCEFSAINSLFYGFVLCKSITTKINSGSAKFLIEPQTLYDVDMKPVKPKSYKLTFEVLRRNPDYCYIYSDDFRSYVENFNIFTRYYDIKQGYFRAVGDPNDGCTLECLSADADSEYYMRYDKFGSITVNVQFKHAGTECGIIVGDSRVGIRGDYIVIYNGGIEVKQIYTPRIYKDKMNQLTVRVRGTQGRIWLNGFDISIETLTPSYRAGMYSIKAKYSCVLFEIRDSNNMYMQESITITTPSGVENLGRIKRNVESIDEQNSIIVIKDGMEEIDTRTETISDDWDFFHTKEFSIDGNFEINIKFDDIGFWLKRILLVDSEGASVAFYNDIFSYMYWFNESSNKYGFKGCAIWCTGEENPSIYQYLDKEV